MKILFDHIRKTWTASYIFAKEKSIEVEAVVNIKLFNE